MFSVLRNVVNPATAAVCRGAALRVAVGAVVRPAAVGTGVLFKSTLPKVEVETAGKAGEADYRVFFKVGGKRISPWHDLPMWADKEAKTVTFISEMPKGTNAKMELATKEEGNPIKQDVKKGALRFIKYGNTIINYGATPQTWEDPDTKHPDLPDVGGDNDPIDVIEIGSAVLAQGTVTEVKPLGVLALIDEGECDWKLLAIATSDPKASQINGLADIDKHYPGMVDRIRTWYRDYKIPDGKPANTYAFDGEAKDRDYAIAVLEDCHKDWKALMGNDAVAAKHKLWTK